MSARDRLAELGLELPKVTPPLAAYIPAVQSGPHVYVSGQVPMVESHGIFGVGYPPNMTPAPNPT